MTKNKHSIQKVFLDIDTPSMVMANSIKNNLAVFIQNELIPILEKQFDLLENAENQIIQIEKLEISINSNTDKPDVFLYNNEEKKDIKNQIEKEIQKTLSDLKKGTKQSENNSELHTISSHDKEIKTLLYFIQNGSMPWWITKEDEIVFFEEMNFENLKRNVFKIPFRKLIQQKNIQQRIINQFSNYQISMFASTLFHSENQQKSLSKNNLIQFLDKNPHNFKTSFWRLIFDLPIENTRNLVLFYHENETILLSEKLFFQLFIQSIKAVFPVDISDVEFEKMNKDYLNSKNNKSAKNTDFTIIENKNILEKESHPEINSKDNQLSYDYPLYHKLNEESEMKDKYDFKEEEKNNLKSFYVQNAGLIILHPFIKEMLKSCNLIDDNNIITNKELAAHILHYAATKKENDYENTMLFEKFLCGIPIQQSIRREIRIEEKNKKQVEEMLLSVVEHWSALKNTSIEIVRTEFLQREGKLDLSESNPKLNIERKTQDLLLEKIPWNINIIKIAWIEKLIYTQW